MRNMLLTIVFFLCILDSNGAKRMNVAVTLYRDDLFPLFSEDEIWGVQKYGEYIVANVVIDDHKMERIKLQKDVIISYDIIHADVEQVFEEERHRLNNRSRWTASMRPDIFFENYRDWMEYEAFMAYLLVTYPSITSLSILGETIQGRQIPTISLSTSEEPKPALYIQAAVHAREWLANSATMYILNALCQGYANETAEIHEILNSINIYIVPTVNIDGYIYAWEVDAIWRKNRRDNGDGSFGVDLNRNFDGPEGSWCIPGGASTNPSSNSYCGPYPFSEPEVQATKNFIFDVEGNIRHNIVASVDMHISGPNVLYPWAWSTEHVPQPYYEEYVELAQDISDAIYDVHNVRYGATDDFNGGYSAGTMRDYPFAISNGNIFSFTWEGRNPGLPPDPSYIIPAGQEQLAGILTLAKWVMQS